MTRNTPTASTYYVEFDGLTNLQIKSMAQISYEGKVTGNAKAIASTKGGVTMRQTTSGGFESNPSMTIEVHMSDDPISASFKLYQWFKQCLPASDGGNSNWANNRKTGSIVVYGPGGYSQGNEVLRWNLYRAWIKKYSVSDADVTGGDLAIETYEFVAEHIEKVVSVSTASTESAPALAGVA